MGREMVVHDACWLVGLQLSGVGFQSMQRPGGPLESPPGQAYPPPTSPHRRPDLSFLRAHLHNEQAALSDAIILFCDRFLHDRSALCHSPAEMARYSR